MYLVCISDVHGQFAEVDLPPGDILIIAGDLCERSDDAFREADTWIASFAHRYERIVYVPGNHDQPIVEQPHKYRSMAPTLLQSMLVDETIEIDGIRIHGMPYESKGRENPESLIPPRLDVLVTHEPPYGIRDFPPRARDGHIGNRSLRRVVDEMRPRLHIFGHAHFGHGTESGEDTTYANVAICGRPEKYYGVAHEPTVIQVDDVNVSLEKSV